MKRIKKLASFTLALVMAMAMTLTAFAADNQMHLITVRQNTDDMTPHTYEAYQIFKGDLADNPAYTDEKTTPGVVKYILSNIEWGNGVNGTGLLAALKNNEEIGNHFTNCETAAAVAEVLGGDSFKDSTGSTTTATDIFARIANGFLTTVAGEGDGIGDVQISVIGSGYYLVKDKNGSVVNPDNTNGGAYTRFLLEVVGDQTVTVKSDVPSGDKQVYVNGTETSDANNAVLGSHVSYKITSKVPNYVGYNYYYFIMNDTLSDGLTLDYAPDETPAVDSFHVTVGNTELTRGTHYHVYPNEDGYTFRLAFVDIMDYTVGEDIVVTYSATVNEKAIIGNTGNPNTWTLQYSNNPSNTFDKDRTDETNKPGLPSDEENEPLGKTPEEKTLTYLTELDIIKYDAEERLLAGATFTLTGTSKQVVLKNVAYYAERTADSVGDVYYKLLNGEYTTEKPTGTEYKAIGVGDEKTTTGYLQSGENDYYVPEDTSEYNGKTIYTLVKGTADQYADVNLTYELVEATQIEYVDVPIRIELTSKDAAGSVMQFTGLGAGKYTLTETITPAGYNTIDPIEFEIKFTPPTNEEGKVEVLTGEEECSWEITGWPQTPDGKPGITNTTGIFSADVVNNSGSLLPSTGGIGTTIFYVVGAILVIGAGILLVTKKRMSSR